MKNLELYSGLIAGGLGTGYNLIQGDSLPSALAQGAILGSAVGGGMYGGKALLNSHIIPYRGYKTTISNKIENALYPMTREYASYDNFLNSIVDSLKKSNNYLDEEDIRISLEHGGIDTPQYYDMKKAIDTMNDNKDDFINNTLPAIASSVGAGTGFITGAVINDIFQDKSEREQAQLLSELELLKANGSISPYLDDYLMRNS